MFRRRRGSTRATSQIPAGERIYAIGDVHGRCDLLHRLLQRIDQDDAGRPSARTTLLFIGDLINRGENSAGVIETISRIMGEGRYAVRLIRGNHEEIFLLAAEGDREAARGLIDMGGAATIRSFGISDKEASHGTFGDLAALLKKRIPGNFVDILNSSEDFAILGDYAFVHAGIRPGLPLAEQQPSDLRWIRSEFLESERDHGHVIVHGHTISSGVEQRPNRIGIDTGAYLTERLSAIGLEGDRRWIIDTSES